MNNLDYSIFSKMEPLTKGLSEDKKYCVTKANGTKYLLRISPISLFEIKSSLFAMQERIATLGIPMCVPVEFGICEDGVYSLQSWIDGDDLETVLSYFSETKLYVLGLKAGEILRKIHSITLPEIKEDWEIRHGNVIDERLKAYHKCGIKFDGGDKILKYIELNRHLLKDRPQCFHHGDYHIGNLMMIGDYELCAIDWDYTDFDNFGDPWLEFKCMVSVQLNPYFATGQIRGYFGGEPSKEFWRLFTLYLAAGAITSIPWATDFGQYMIDEILKLNKDVMAWFDNMNNPVPTWYLKDFHIQWIDDVPLKLKKPFDLEFIHKYGTVFKVFDDQDSGNLCFGVQDGDKKYFIKFAGVPTEQYNAKLDDAVARLKATIQVYQDLRHPNLINFIKAEGIGDGFAVVFDWVDAECMGRQYPLTRSKFMQMPIEIKLCVFEDIMMFHAHVAEQGYVAIDFYDGSIMYDFNKNKTIICDIDFYQKTPYFGNLGLWGSKRFISPEERTNGAVIDEITNVYTMGATAFALFADSNRSYEAWSLSKDLFEVAKKAVSDERNQRQQSIKQLMEEWSNAKNLL